MRQGSRLPILPVITKQERKLFYGLVPKLFSAGDNSSPVDLEALTRNWNTEQANAEKKISFKIPILIKQHLDDWFKIQTRRNVIREPTCNRLVQALQTTPVNQTDGSDIINLAPQPLIAPAGPNAQAIPPTNQVSGPNDGAIPPAHSVPGPNNAVGQRRGRRRKECKVCQMANCMRPYNGSNVCSYEPQRKRKHHPMVSPPKRDSQIVLAPSEPYIQQHMGLRAPLAHGVNGANLPLMHRNMLPMVMPAMQHPGRGWTTSHPQQRFFPWPPANEQSLVLKMTILLEYYVLCIWEGN